MPIDKAWLTERFAAKIARTVRQFSVLPINKPDQYLAPPMPQTPEVDICRVTSLTPVGCNSDYYPAKLQYYHADNCTWDDLQDIYVKPINGETVELKKYLCRRHGDWPASAGKPVYSFFCCGGSSSPLTTKGDIYVHSTIDTRLPVGTDGYCLSADSTQATGLKWIPVAGTGTVTSVGLAISAFFTITNSPVTTTGTLTATWQNQSANQILSGPSSGGASAPTFRSLVAADLGTGTADATKCLYGDSTWKNLPDMLTPQTNAANLIGGSSTATDSTWNVVAATGGYTINPPSVGPAVRDFFGVVLDAVGSSLGSCYLDSVLDGDSGTATHVRTMDGGEAAVMRSDGSVWTVIAESVNHWRFSPLAIA